MKNEAIRKPLARLTISTLCKGAVGLLALSAKGAASRPLDSFAPAGVPAFAPAAPTKSTASALSAPAPRSAVAGYCPRDVAQYPDSVEACERHDIEAGFVAGDWFSYWRGCADPMASFQAIDPDELMFGRLQMCSNLWEHNNHGCSEPFEICGTALLP